MKSKIALATLSLILSSPAVAQTASNQQFSDQLEAEAFVLQEVGISVLVDPSVERIMIDALKHPETNSDRAEKTLKRAGRPAIHDAAPGWMKGNQSQNPSSRQTSTKPTNSVALLGPMMLHKSCSLAYQPAGFLSRQTERRREAYFPAMVKAACAANIPARLFDALIIQESRYNTFAISSAGARGLTQLMPGTAKYVDTKNSFSPEQNLRGGAKYLREQIDSFGLTPNALAAYNAGPGNVVKHGGIPPFRETRNYVRAIMTNVQRLSVPRSVRPNRPVQAVGGKVDKTLSGARYGRAAELISYGF